MWPWLNLTEWFTDLGSQVITSIRTMLRLSLESQHKIVKKWFSRTANGAKPKEGAKPSKKTEHSRCVTQRRKKRQASRQEIGRRETLSHTWKLRLFACTTLSVDPGHVSFYIESSAGVQAYLLVRVDIEPVRVVEWQPQHAACQRQAVQLVKIKKKKEKHDAVLFKRLE